MKLLDTQTRVGLRSILLAVDFSSSSEVALLYAAATAHRYGSRIYLAHIIQSDALQLVSPERSGIALEPGRAYAEQQMAKLMVSGRLRGTQHQVLLGQGDIAPALFKMIGEHEIDLVVVGTHGRTGLRKMLLGSVAEQIFRMAPCPVLTVGPKVSGEAPEEIELRQILFATDFTPSSECALGYALSLAQEHQAQLTLLHVVSDIADATEPGAVEQLESLPKRMRALVPAEVDLWCDPKFAVEFGIPPEKILKVAGERMADMIVLGMRRPAKVPLLSPPATAYGVVCQAHCPVLTVPD